MWATMVVLTGPGDCGSLFIKRTCDNNLSPTTWKWIPEQQRARRAELSRALVTSQPIPPCPLCPRRQMSCQPFTLPAYTKPLTVVLPCQPLKGGLYPDFATAWYRVPFFSSNKLGSRLPRCWRILTGPHLEAGWRQSHGGGGVQGGSR